MYAGIDIGGSKTLAASLDDNGVIIHKIKFETPQSYDDFLSGLGQAFDEITAEAGSDDFRAAGVAVPGRIDRLHGIGRAFGNLPWRDVPLQRDIEKLLACPAVLEHDPSLAALSEAMLVKHLSKVLYITVSTGIGAGLVVDRHIDPNFAGSEAGQMLVEHRGRLRTWESFASGSAISHRYGKLARDIPASDKATWQTVARHLSRGLMELIAITEPDIVVIGGSVGRYFDRFASFLDSELRRFPNPLVPIPPLKAAERPDDAVLYGCYDLAREIYGPGSRRGRHPRPPAHQLREAR